MAISICTWSCSVAIAILTGALVLTHAIPRTLFYTADTLLLDPKCRLRGTGALRGVHRGVCFQFFRRDQAYLFRLCWPYCAHVKRSVEKENHKQCAHHGLHVCLSNPCPFFVSKVT